MLAPSAPWLYRLGFAVTYAFIRIFRGMRVEGAENIPRTGRIIVASNHISLLDPPLVSVAVYSHVRFPRFVAKEELFRVPGLGFFLRGIGCIPLSRGRTDVGAIRRALAVLEGEGCLVLFPEGTRSKTGLPGVPKPGVGLLAREADTMVVPARVWNTPGFMPGARLRVRFGKPLAYSGGGDRQDCRDFANKIMDEIFSLT